MMDEIERAQYEQHKANAATHGEIVPAGVDGELGMCQACGAAEVEIELYSCDEFRERRARATPIWPKFEEWLAQQDTRYGECWEDLESTWVVFLAGAKAALAASQQFEGVTREIHCRD